MFAPPCRLTSSLSPSTDVHAAAERILIHGIGVKNQSNMLCETLVHLLKKKREKLFHTTSLELRE
jgi:hypothetical protein